MKELRSYFQVFNVGRYNRGSKNKERMKRKMSPLQGNHGTGKTGKMAKKNPCQGKHREFGNFAKTQGICLLKL